MGTRQYNERANKLVMEGAGKNHRSSDFLKIEDTAPGFMKGTKGYTSDQIESALKKADAKEMDSIRKRAVEAADESRGFLSKISPTYKANANKDFSQAVKDFKKIPQEVRDEAAYDQSGHKKGGAIKKMARGGAVKSSASRRADGIAMRGKTKGRLI